jgi:hypothetical protein
LRFFSDGRIDDGIGGGLVVGLVPKLLVDGLIDDEAEYRSYDGVPSNEDNGSVYVGHSGITYCYDFKLKNYLGLGTDIKP